MTDQRLTRVFGVQLGHRFADPGFQPGDRVEHMDHDGETFGLGTVFRVSTRSQSCTVHFDSGAQKSVHFCALRWTKF